MELIVKEYASIREIKYALILTRNHQSAVQLTMLVVIGAHIAQHKPHSLICNYLLAHL